MLWKNVIVTVSFGYDMKYILFITFQFNIYVYIYRVEKNS